MAEKANRDRDLADPLHAKVCSCGDCKKVLDTVLLDLKNDHCLHYFVARATATSVVARLLMQMDGSTPGTSKNLETRFDRITELLMSDIALDYALDGVSAALLPEEAKH